MNSDTTKPKSEADILKMLAQPTTQTNYTPPPPEPPAIESEIDEEEIENNIDSDENIDEITECGLAFVDGINETAFKIIANMKRNSKAVLIDGENGLRRLQELKAQKNSNKNSGVEVIEPITGKDAQLLELDAKVEAFIADLPFTERQLDMMRPGLRAIVKNNAGNLPPEMFFYGGLITAVGGNIAELYNL